jgi:3-hydroxyisobutyrate dehydrogenase
MGAAMAERLIELGDDVAVWNRTAARAEPLVELGAARAATPADLAAASDVVICMLFDDDAVLDVYEGEDGLGSIDLSGKLVIEMSTIRAATSRRVADAVAGAGGVFVECPVGGTVPPARQGQLLGMAGGEIAAVEQARPTLEKLCRRFEHVGDVGTGALMKLALNLPMMVYFEALGEAFCISERAGIDRQLAADLMADSSGAAKVAGIFLPGIVQAMGGDIPEGAIFDMSGATKDMHLLTEYLAEQGLDLPVTAATSDSYDAAVADGWQDRNFPLLAAWRVLHSAMR